MFILMFMFKKAKQTLLRLAFFAVVSAPLSSEAADVSTKDYAARTELRQIQTLTLSDYQFLTGDSGGMPVTITGQLRIAQGSGRLPLVVLQHGSGGYTPGVEYWSRKFNELGISTFALDGFSGRGLTEVNTNQALLGRLNFILDIYRALDVVAAHPRVDPNRIALMGFSRGGQAVLYASLKRFQRMWNKSGVEFAAYIPFYPDCMTSYASQTDIVDRPIRIFGGTPDDYDPISACKDYVGQLKALGHDVQLTEYQNAPHTFDNPLGAEPAVMLSAAQTVRNCKIREVEVGVLFNVATNQPFSYKDECVELGAHLGRNPVAAEAATVAVTDLVKAVFRLP
jgi:dienelactone hydrolase